MLMILQVELKEFKLSRISTLQIASKIEFRF